MPRCINDGPNIFPLKIGLKRREAFNDCLKFGPMKVREFRGSALWKHRIEWVVENLRLGLADTLGPKMSETSKGPN